MVSRISVYNLVAGMLGESPVLVMPTAQDDTPIARAIDRYWDSARGAALRANTWRFARTRAQLPALSTPPAFGFAFAFNLPSDFVRIVELGIPSASGWAIALDRFEREGMQILADYAPLNLVYIRDMPEPETWDGDFELGFAMMFASMAAYDITGDMSLGQALRQDFEKQFADAQVADGNDGPPLTFEEDNWLTARWGDPYGYRD